MPNSYTILFITLISFFILVMINELCIISMEIDTGSSYGIKAIYLCPVIYGNTGMLPIGLSLRRLFEPGLVIYHSDR